MLGVVQLLRFLQDVRGSCLGHDGNPILVGGNDVAGVDGDTGADDRNVDARHAVVVDRRRWHHATAEDRELQLANLRRVANRRVDHRAGKPAILHRRSHQAADAGEVGAILQHHDVDRTGRRRVDQVQHALRCRRSLFVLFFFQLDGDRWPRELRRRQRPHLVRHVGALAVQLLDSVGHRRDLHHPEVLHQRIPPSIVSVLGEEPRRADEGRNRDEQECALHFEYFFRMSSRRFFR